MNDTTQQQPPVQQPPMNAFGGAVPFTNIKKEEKKDDLAKVVYGPTPEAGPAQVENTDSVKTAESAPEVKKAEEYKPEKVLDIEKREQKQYYPQNQQQQQQAQIKPPVSSLKSPMPAPRFFGYTVSPQIANNFPLISAQKGRGDSGKSRTWIYVLLDRILKRQTYLKK